MNILIPTTGFLRAGGMRVLSELASGFIKLGHHVVFLAPDDGVDPYFPTLAAIVRYPVPFSQIPFLRYILKVFSMAWWIRKHRSGYDAIIANAASTAFPVAFGARGVGNGYYYIQAYEPDFANERRWPLSAVESFISRRTYGLNLVHIVNSSLYLNYHEIKARHIVEPGIDLEIFCAREPVVADSSTLTIGCVGRKEKWKGTHLVIEAVREVRRERNLDIRLRIAFNLPDEYDSSDDCFVELVNPHGDRNLANFYRATNLFCAVGTIQNGAFHYPCMEAMACGTSVITNYGPGNEENSYFLHNVSVHEIKRAIGQYLDNGIAARNVLIARGLEAVKHYTWPTIAGKMIEIFNAEKRESGVVS